MKKTLLLALLLVGASLVAQQQSFAGYMQAGADAEAQSDYYSAYKFYEIATEYPGRKNDPEALYRLGAAAHMARAYRVSERALQELSSNSEVLADYPLIKYLQGQNNLYQGEYDLAAAFFDEFLTEQPTAPDSLKAIATNQVLGANWALEELTRARDIKMRPLGAPVNSEYSDFGFTRRGNGQNYYTSHRFKFERDTVNPRRKLSKILQYNPGAEPAPLGEEINVADLNVSHTAFNTAGDKVFFSICEYVTYDGVRCDIYVADVAGDGSWSNPQKTEINVEGASTRMPNVGQDPTTGNEFLYFASDREGGAGGLDLYRSTLADDGTIGDPQNLERVNSAGDDVTPFYYAPRQTLFFSTNGRFSFGGLDVYKSSMINGTFLEPINLGSPENSSYDDAYYSQFEGDEVAYLSSTRHEPGAIFFDETKEVCCYDIYSFTPDNRVDLLVTTYNKLNDKDLAGVEVVLYEITTNGPVEIDRVTNVDGNDFSFKVEPNRRYQIVGTKDGFSQDIDAIDLSQPEFRNQAVVYRELYLAPSIDLEVLTFNRNDNTKLSGTTVALYRIEADGTEVLVDQTTNPDDNFFTFPLEYGNHYIVKGNRPDFGEDSAEIDLRDVEPDGSTSIRRELYLGQLLKILVIDGITEEPLNNATVGLAGINGVPIGDPKTNQTGNDFYYVINLDQNFVVNTSREGYISRRDELVFTRADVEALQGRLEFIVPLFRDDITIFPITVYFDNDHPNPRTTRRTTTLSYEDTYTPYYNRRDTFIQEVTEGLDQEDSFLLGNRLKRFFDLQVQSGWQQLQASAEVLNAYLTNTDNTITLVLKGYASPRAANEYNMRLSQRRIVSVQNYYARWNDGALADAISRNRLRFTTDALGESTADANVISDRLDNPKESVFGLAASLERRVIISNAEDAADSSRRK